MRIWQEEAVYILKGTLKQVPFIFSGIDHF
jgi:hypothetical protein